MEFFNPLLPAGISDALEASGRTFYGAPATGWSMASGAVTAPAPVVRDAATLATPVPAGVNAVSFRVSTDGGPLSRLKLVASSSGSWSTLWEASGVSAWQTVTRPLPVSTTECRWVWERNDTGAQNTFSIDTVNFFTTTALTDALDEPSLAVISTPGTITEWTRTTTDTLDGDAAVSGAVSPGQTSGMETTVSGPAVVSWSRRVNGAGGTLTVTDNDSLLSEWTGAGNWEREAWVLAAGSHVLRWAFTASDAGATSARVDQLKISPVSATVNGITFTNTGSAAWVLGTDSVWTSPSVLYPGKPARLEASLTEQANLKFQFQRATSAAVTVPGGVTPSGNYAGLNYIYDVPLPSGTGTQTWDAAAPAGNAVGNAACTLRNATIALTGLPDALGLRQPWLRQAPARLSDTGTLDFESYTTGNVTWQAAETEITGPAWVDCRLFANYSFGAGPKVWNIYMDGTSVRPYVHEADGLPAPAQPSFFVPAGAHRVRWDYSQQGFGGGGGFSYLVHASIGAVAVQPSAPVSPAAIADALDTSFPCAADGNMRVLPAGSESGGDALTFSRPLAQPIAASVTGPAVARWRTKDPFPPVFEGTGWNTATSLIASGAQQLILESGTGTGEGLLDSLEIFTAADFAAALDNTLTWSFGNTTPLGGQASSALFFVDHGTSWKGASAVTALPGGNAWVQAIFTGPGTLLYAVKGNSYQARRGGALSVLDSWGGSETTWALRSIVLPAGNTPVRWVTTTGFTPVTIDNIHMATAFESWLLTHRTLAELSLPGAFDPLADTDHDGLAAVVEFALGTSPVTASPDAVPVLSRDPASPWLLRFTWQEPLPAAAATMTAECSGDLSVWQPLSAVQTASSAGSRTMQATMDTGTAPKCYFRLRITLP